MSRSGRTGAATVLVTGFAMGAADLVPGFSGGTVALVAGIYERLIGEVRTGARALGALARLRPTDAWRALRALDLLFVVALLAGVATALVTLSRGVERLLAERPVLVSATFLGLVLGASVAARRRFRRPRAVHVIGVVAAAAVTFVALGATPGTLEAPGPLVLAGAGAVAVSAMILPGVSGSFLMLLLGVYPVVIGALSARDVVTLAPFALGMVVGLAVFSTVLDALLRRAHDAVLAVLVGLMVGSVRVLWPWPVGSGVGDPSLGAPGEEWPVALALALAAGGAVVAVSRLGDGRTRRS